MSMYTFVHRIDPRIYLSIICILALSLLVVSYRYSRLHQEFQDLAKKTDTFPVTADIVVPIITHCMTSLTLSDRISKNCGDAYTTLGTCLTDIDACNLAESSEKLEQLNREKEELLGQMNLQTESLRNLVESIKKN